MELIKKPVLCESIDCTACAACSSVCSRNAIAMAKDANGFCHPIIDEKLCIGCLRCQKVCPIINCSTINNYPIKVVASWHLDDMVRYDSSSGGAFSAISEYVLGRNGIVWGAAYDEGMTLKYQCVDDLEGLVRLQKSKYVQSEIDDSVYSKIKQQVEEGKLVLFCGTSCHVRGLLNVVGNHERLLTMDFICHGVASPKVFKSYIDSIEHKKNIKIGDFGFRDKRFGTSYNIATSCQSSKGEDIILTGNDNSFARAFCRDLILRDCCYQCKNNGVSRPSDFTVADYRGKDAFATVDEMAKGISVVICNTARAVEILPETQMKCYDQTLESVIKSNPNYTKTNNIGKRKLKASFFADFAANNYDVITDKYLKISLGDRVKTVVMRVFGPKFFYYLKRLK